MAVWYIGCTGHRMQAGSTTPKKANYLQFLVCASREQLHPSAFESAIGEEIRQGKETAADMRGFRTVQKGSKADNKGRSSQHHPARTSSSDSCFVYARFLNPSKRSHFGQNLSKNALVLLFALFDWSTKPTKANRSSPVQRYLFGLRGAAE